MIRLDVAPPVSFVPAQSAFHLVLSSIGMLTAIGGVIAWQVLKQRSSPKARRGLFVAFFGLALYTAAVLLGAAGIPGGRVAHALRPWPELPDGAPLPPEVPAPLDASVD